MGFEADLSTFSETTPVQELGPLMEDASFNLVRSQTVSPGRPGLSLRARPTSSSDSRYSQVSFVRSQPLGLPSSMRSPRMDDSPGKMEAELSSRHTVQLSPCKSGNFGLKRSDSLPIFPPDKQAFKQDDPFKLVGSVDDLPSNPKTWTPSQLAVYLAHVLRITPAPIIRDIIAFVMSKRLTGRKFLRFREQDFKNLDINPAWARIMAEAREKLRMDCLRGRILGAEDEDPPINSDYAGLTIPEIEEVKQKSWKMAKKGRVKNISSLFERPAADDTRQKAHSRTSSLTDLFANPPSPHSRSNSNEQSDGNESEAESTVSDTQYANDWKASSPLDVSHVFESSSLSTPELSPSSQQTDSPSLISPFTDNEAAYDTTTIVPGLQISLTEPEVSSAFSTMTKRDKELKIPHAQDVFACAEKASEGMTSITSRNGSMIMVKKSQLADLQARMDQMERMLADLQTEQAEQADETDARQATSRESFLEPGSLTSLSGYVMMTSVGLGLICAEVVFNKLFRR